MPTDRTLCVERVSDSPHRLTAASKVKGPTVDLGGLAIDRQLSRLRIGAVLDERRAGRDALDAMLRHGAGVLLLARPEKRSCT